MGAADCTAGDGGASAVQITNPPVEPQHFPVVTASFPGMGGGCSTGGGSGPGFLLALMRAYVRKPATPRPQECVTREQTNFDEAVSQRGFPRSCSSGAPGAEARAARRRMRTNQASRAQLECLALEPPGPMLIVREEERLNGSAAKS